MTGVGGHRELGQLADVPQLGQLVLTESHRDEAGWELRAGTPDSQNIISQQECSHWGDKAESSLRLQRQANSYRLKMTVC